MSTTNLRGNTAHYSIRYYRYYVGGDPEKCHDLIIGWKELCRVLSDGLLHTDVEIREVTRNGQSLFATAERLEQLVQEAKA